MEPAITLWTLFASSFLAATLIPAGSEPLLAAIVYAQPDLAWRAVGVATLGNTLGGLTSYGIGRLIPKTRPLKGLAAVRRWGAPILLLSWLPFVGDALCVAAGWLRLNVIASTFFMAVGKLARYAAIAAVVV